MHSKSYHANLSCLLSCSRKLTNHRNKFRDWTKKFGQDYSDQEASTAKSSSTAKKPNTKRKAIATDGFESDADDKDGVVVGKNGQHSGQSPRKKAKTSAAPKKSTASRSSTKVTVEDVSADTGNNTEEDTADTEKGTGSRGVAKSRDGSVSSSEGTRHPVGRESSAEFV